MLILCDVDGVLCDFVGYLGKKLNRTIVDKRPAPYTLEDLFGVSRDDIRSVLTQHLLKPYAWATLPDTPFVDGTLWLLAQAAKRGHRAFVISNMCSLDRYCDTHEELLSLAYASHSGRAWWLKKKRDSDKRLQRAHIEWVFDIDRMAFANDNTILIDDNEHNIVRFIRSGGHGILVPAPWNSLWKEFDDRRGYAIVKRRLMEIIDAHEERCRAVSQESKCCQCPIPNEDCERGCDTQSQ